MPTTSETHTARPSILRRRPQRRLRSWRRRRRRPPSPLRSTTRIRAAKVLPSSSVPEQKHTRYVARNSNSGSRPAIFPMTTNERRRREKQISAFEGDLLSPLSWKGSLSLSLVCVCTLLPSQLSHMVLERRSFLPSFVGPPERSKFFLQFFDGQQAVEHTRQSLFLSSLSTRRKSRRRRRRLSCDNARALEGWRNYDTLLITSVSSHLCCRRRPSGGGTGGGGSLFMAGWNRHTAQCAFRGNSCSPLSTTQHSGTSVCVSLSLSCYRVVFRARSCHPRWSNIIVVVVVGLPLTHKHTHASAGFCRSGHFVSHPHTQSLLHSLLLAEDLPTGRWTYVRGVPRVVCGARGLLCPSKVLF